MKAELDWATKPNRVVSKEKNDIYTKIIVNRYMIEHVYHWVSATENHIRNQTIRVSKSLIQFRCR